MSLIRLRALAEDYSRSLSEGTEIIADTDGEHVKPFHHLLGGLLAQRGLVLAPTERGEIVKKAPWLGRAPVGVFFACRHCGHSVFECPHDVGIQIIGAWPDQLQFMNMAEDHVKPAVLA